MPKVNYHARNYLIENLTAREALKKGYLTSAECDTQQAWIAEDPLQRINNTLVYIDGVYRGTARRSTAIHKIVDNFLK